MSNKDVGFLDTLFRIENYVKEKCEEYKKSSEDHYDFWSEHIELVLEQSTILAFMYGADIEVVKLGALLHDIALILKVGDKKDHHINGEKIAKKILIEFDYDEDKMDQVLKCVLHHRSSKNATSIEEICVADADILAHFYNIPMLFNSAYRNNVKPNDIRNWIADVFRKDYNDLSDKTKAMFEPEYNEICDKVLGKGYQVKR